MKTGTIKGPFSINGGHAVQFLVKEESGAWRPFNEEGRVKGEALCKQRAQNYALSIMPEAKPSRIVKIKFAWPHENFSVRYEDGKQRDNKFTKAHAKPEETGQDVLMTWLAPQITKFKNLGTYSGKKIVVEAWYHDALLHEAHANGQPKELRKLDLELNFTEH